MKNPFLNKYPLEFAENLNEALQEIKERIKEPDFNYFEIEEILYDFGIEPDYVIDIINQLV